LSDTPPADDANARETAQTEAIGIEMTEALDEMTGASSWLLFIPTPRL
jgi:hypothetical protein